MSKRLFGVMSGSRQPARAIQPLHQLPGRFLVVFRLRLYLNGMPMGAPKPMKDEDEIAAWRDEGEIVPAPESLLAAALCVCQQLGALRRLLESSAALARSGQSVSADVLSEIEKEGPAVASLLSEFLARQQREGPIEERRHAPREQGPADAAEPEERQTSAPEPEEGQTSAPEPEEPWYAPLARAFKERLAPAQQEELAADLFSALRGVLVPDLSRHFRRMQEHGDPLVPRSLFDFWAERMGHPDLETRWEYAFCIFRTARLPGFEQDLPLLRVCDLPVALRLRVFEAEEEEFGPGPEATEQERAEHRLLRSVEEIGPLLEQVWQDLERGAIDCRLQRQIARDMCMAETVFWEFLASMGIPRPMPDPALPMV